MTRNFTEADVVRWFGAHEVLKARPYAHAISRLSVSDQRITASVKGTARAAYRVEVNFLDDAGTGATRVVSNCNCPVGMGCKHGAAALLAALRERPVATDQVRSEVHEWLTQLQGLIVQPGEARSAPKKQAQGLFYVLAPRPVPPHPWEVRFLKGPINVDGSMGRGARPWTNVESALLKPPAFLGEDDEAIVRLLWTQRAREGLRHYFGGMPLGERHLSEIIPKILATGRAYTTGEDGTLSRLSDGEARTATLEWAVESAGIRARLAGSPAFDRVLPGAPPWYIDLRHSLAGPIDTTITPSMLSHLLHLPALGEAEARVVAGSLEKLAPDLPRPIDLSSIQRITAPLRGVLVVEHLPNHGHGEDLTVVVPQFAYGETLIGSGHAGEFANAPDGTPIRVARDTRAEMSLLDALRAEGFQSLTRQRVLVESTAPGQVPHVLPDEDDWFDFESEALPRLQTAGWEVHLPEPFYYRSVTPESWYAELDAMQAIDPTAGWGSGGNDFALTMGIEVDGRRIALAPLIHQMLRNDPRWFDAQRLSAITDDEPIRFQTDEGINLALPAGRLKPLVRTLVDLLDQPSAHAIPISALDAIRLVEATTGPAWQTRGMDTAQVLHDRLKQAAGVSPVPAPAGFGAALRPYQLTGLAWLQYLREHRLGGILADDMGLGKTAQTLAHLLTEKIAGRLGPDAGGKPALVILPTSLIFNWKREAERFAPQLSMLSLHGTDRKARFDQISQHDVVLTTYPLLWRDAEALKACSYHTLVLDEAQTVKNAASRASATVRELRADHRLCLTGTPLENHLGELWTQFDFLLPGFLGDARQFARNWRAPIEKHSDALRREALARRIRPFILRRKKEDVAKELPPKSIIVRTVELEGAQRDLYETVRSMMDQKVRDEIAKRGFARSQIVILDALLKLRQTCCDPRLLKSTAAHRVKEHAKLDLLMAMLPELVDEGRRVLVFSQFAEMLDLIEQELLRHGLRFVRLSGKTKDRETPIQRFQAGEVPIFLISLKAGGVGLNLTAADTVIHYDPWWNPAAENQATDRAHRIGQTKHVFVYKLIVAGSIEEKILALQDKKAALAEGILSDKADALTKFSPADISALLAPLPTG